MQLVHAEGDVEGFQEVELCDAGINTVLNLLSVHVCMFMCHQGIELGRVFVPRIPAEWAAARA